MMSHFARFWTCWQTFWHESLVSVSMGSVRTGNAMPVSCSAVNCTNRWTKGSSVKFFVFPADPERRKRWVVAISWDKWFPSKHDCLCSAHFITGRPSSVPENVDYVPSLFMDGKKRRSTPSEKSGRCGRANKRVKVREEMVFAAEKCF